MGRAFEARKHAKLKRWGNMAKTFSRLSKELTIAAKQGGSNPGNNPRLKLVMQNAKNEQMPKDKIDMAIARADNKNLDDYQEIVYEGYGPHSTAFIIEASTNNTNRTASNIRSYFTRSGGSLCPSGTHSYIFDHRVLFIIETKNINKEELLFDLIDYGVEELEEENGELIIDSPFKSFGAIHKILEEKNASIIETELKRIPTVTKSVNEEQFIELEKLINKLDEDEDVNFVYTNAIKN